ncbi:MAG: 3-phosphoshikimate 1-carboxyvinyltransferase, partial [Helicobacter sp.]|nr:3-phosphoshikimate 1-carboxyvinyltransferase [Helicobacter sp.]
MNVVRLLPREPVRGEIADIATDKSISHRAAILSLLCAKTSRVRGYLRAEDTLHTLQIAKNLGLSVQENDDELILTPPKDIAEPACILDCGNAGTAMRLFCGLLAGVQGRFFVLDGDCYLRARPMRRVVAPLVRMGAQIWGREGDSLAPLAVRGSALCATNYESPVASAQIKSAFVLAALQADGECVFAEPELSRDHTERMLTAMGAKLLRENQTIRISPLQAPLEPLDLEIPSDPSSAFFFAVAAAIVPGSEIVLRNVLL